MREPANPVEGRSSVTLTDRATYWTLVLALGLAYTSAIRFSANRICHSNSRRVLSDTSRNSHRCSAAGSRRRLHGKKLAVAHWNEAGRKPGIGRHQCDERGHLLNVRRRVIHDQQASRA